MRQFKGGQSNPTYLLETPRRRYVLRRKPPGKLLPSAHAVDREFRIIGALHAQRFPVAEPVLYCADEAVVGTPFYVMGYVEGRVIWEPHMPGAHAGRARGGLRRDERHPGAAAFVRSGGDRACRFRPRRELRGAPGRALVEAVPRLRDREHRRDGAADRLAAGAPAAAGPVRLVHGDYRLDNIILAAGGPSVLAVLDWELSTLGDPLADLAYHLMQWDMPPSETGAGVGTLLGHDLAALGIPARAAYVDAYVARTGLDPRAQLPVYLAYNFFRLAAILQGIVGRVRDGTATSESAAAMAPLVRPLAAKGWAFAQEAGAR